MLAICGLLLLAVGLIFGQTVCHKFINLDDGMYVYENPQVSRGISTSGIALAFAHLHAGYWIPLTWISYMLDSQFYGPNAAGYHLTNVLLHAATVITLFLVLWQMTGRVWPCGLAAVLFAVHPLRVESVAWVTERKDVLSGLFFVLTLGAYVRYARHPWSLIRYLAVMVFLVLGLMSKPMLVTLPLVLLLLDYWPLGRMTTAAGEDTAGMGDGRASRFAFPMRLLLDKLPILLLVGAFCAVTVWTQRGGMATNTVLPFWGRIANALVSYVAYLVQFFYPVGLVVFYPHPGANLPAWKIIGALVVLASISAGMLACRRRLPYLLMGWLWYLGMLVPVSGVAQAGLQARADRFTYLPQIGLCIALAWAVADVSRAPSCRRWACGIVSALVLAVLMGCAWRQTSFWRDSETLWTHTLACISQNSFAHKCLGSDLQMQGRLDEAMIHYRKALEIDPHYADAHNELGRALIDKGRLGEADAHCRKALEIDPDCAEAHNNLGNVLANRGQSDEAIARYQKALEIKPDFAEAHHNLGNALANRGQSDEAIAQYQMALEIKPDYAEAHNNLGNALANRGHSNAAIAQYQMALEIKPNYTRAYNNLGVAFARLGRFDEAMIQYQKALEIKPDYAEAHHNLGNALANRGRLDEAMTQYRKALEIKPDLAEAHLKLGAALAARRRLDEAVVQYRKALDLATRNNNQALADALRAKIALCEAGKTLHQPPPASAPRPPKP